MGADAPATPCMKPPPPALFAVRTRSRVPDLGAGAAFSGPPDTPPRRSPVTVPFLWEDAPGKPKAPPPTAANAGPFPRPCGRADKARPLPPLKLPPRLQHVASFAATDNPLSPKTVLGRRPPRWAGSSGAAFRRTPSAGVGLFSRTWSKPSAAAGSSKNPGGDHERDEAGPDAPWCSPASSSSSSSSSSVSTCFGSEDVGHGRPANGREPSSSEEEDDGSPRGSVRITRFRRNRSLPSMTTSNLWASIRRSVKQITPWS